MHIIEDPIVPSAHPLKEPLRDGSEISVRGNVTHGHHKDFAIELLSGPNIVLHVNFRFEGEHDAVMNSYLNNAWGSEVLHRNPLKRNEPFNLRIYVHEGYYNISVNNEHLAEFPHRIPVQTVQAVGVKGSVTVDSIAFKGFESQQAWGQPQPNHGYSAYGSTGYFAPQFENTQYY